MKLKITYEKLTIEIYQSQSRPVEPDYIRDYAIEQYQRRAISGGFPDRQNIIHRIRGNSHD